MAGARSSGGALLNLMIGRLLWQLLLTKSGTNNFGAYTQKNFAGYGYSSGVIFLANISW
jgi:hypothetical protein